MNPPPTYPRIPYLWAPGDTADDDLVATDRSQWLIEPVVVEEKLDGANVVIWQEGSRLAVASRGGPGAMDRAGQLGRLRAWAAARHPTLEPLLAGGRALYGEWLWLTHGVRYTALPDLFVALDLWTAADGFADVDTRDRLVSSAGLVTPPELFRGVLRSPEALKRLLGGSRWSTEPAEGLMLRSLAGYDRVKVVRPDFRRRTDAQWSARRHVNTVVDSIHHEEARR